MNKKSASHKKDGDTGFIKWFSELNSSSVEIAGGKGANLAEMYKMKMPVPPGFVITTTAYNYFLEKAGLKEKIQEILNRIDYEDTKQLEQSAKKIREMIEKAEMPNEIEEEIIESYENLDSIDINENGMTKMAYDILTRASEPVFVAVRSSATAEDLADASFAGQQETFVNVKGRINLIESVKKCFASLFTARAIYYRHKKGFTTASLAVIVQKMINSDKSGVIFTKDPSYNSSNMIIEAVYGLGEGIVSGKISPDNYILSHDKKIIEKNIGYKKIALTRDSAGSQETIRLSETRAKSIVLSDYEIKKLADYALKLEEHYEKPQDIEFAIEGSEIYIVQTRPITTLKKRFDLNNKSQKSIEGEEILKGMAASPGIGVGRVKIVHDLKDLEQVQNGDVLVTEMTNPDMVVTMQKSTAIVTDEGGLTSHAAIVSREMGIPCVVGTETATKKLKNGEIITVDGFTGKIYAGKKSENVAVDILPIVNTKTKIKVIVDLPDYAERAAKTGAKAVGLVRIEGIIAESGKHPEYFLKHNKINEYQEIIYKGVNGIAKYFDEIWVRTSDIRTDEFRNLEGSPEKKEANPMLGMHGIRYGLKNPEILTAELKALKKVAEHGKIVGVMMPQIILVDEVKKVKEMLKEIEFKNAKIGVMIETPAAVQIIKSLCEEGIKFISFGTNDLTQYMLAIDRGNEDVQYLYDETNPAILYQLAFVIRTCKRYNVESSICGQAGSKKEMVKFLVENGIDSISVNADAAHEISKFVAELEERM